MADEDRPGTYIGGKWYNYAEEKPRPAPSEDQIMEAVRERREDAEGGAEPGELREYLDDIADDESAGEPRQVFKNVEEAESERRAQREARAEAEQAAERQKRQEARTEREADIERAREWAPDDQAVIGSLQDRVARFNRDAAAFVEIQKRAAQDQSFQTPQARQQLAEAAQRLQAERATLQQAAAQVQEAAQIKNSEAARRKLYRDFPELADKDTREELIRWAKKKGIPEERARAETDPAVVGQAFRQMQREKQAERQQHLDRPRPVPRRQGALAKAGPTPERMTPAEAKERLAKTGSPLDALNLLSIRAARAREATDG